MPRAARRLGGLRPSPPAGDAVLVLLYIRYSSAMQADGWSLDAQRRLLEEFCAARGWAVAGVYADEARSGKDEHRPGYQQLLARAAAGGIGRVVVHKIDRFARNLPLLLAAVGELDRLGVGLVCAAQGIDTGDPLAGRLLLVLLGYLAEMYLENLSGEVIKGLRERAGQGLPLGGLPWGYGPGAPGPDGHRAPPALDPGVAALYRAAADLYDPSPPRPRPDGLGELPTFAAVAAWLNARGARLRGRVPGRNPGGLLLPDTVAHLLQSPFYAGLIVYDDPASGARLVFPGRHEAATDQAQIERIRAKAAGRPGARAAASGRGGRPAHVANGIVRCAACGAPLGLTYAGGGGARYVCQSPRRGVACPSRARSVPAPALDGALDLLAGRLSLPPAWREEIARARDAAGAGAGDAAARRRALAATLGRVHDRYEAGGYPSRAAYLARVAGLEAEIAAAVPAGAAAVERAGAAVEGIAALWAGLAPAGGPGDPERAAERRAFLSAAFADLAMDLDRRALVRAALRPDYAPLAGLLGTLLPEGGLRAPAPGPRSGPAAPGTPFTPEAARAARARGSGYRGRAWADSGRGRLEEGEIDAAEAARALGIDVSGVRRLVRAGRLRARAAGGRHALAAAEVAALAAERAAEAARALPPAPDPPPGRARPGPRGVRPAVAGDPGPPTGGGRRA